MFKQFKKLLSKKEYTFTEENLMKMLKEIEQELRGEIEAEYTNKLQELQDKIQMQNTYISNLEKDCSTLTIKSDILQSKLNEKELEVDKTIIKLNKRKGKDLASEIFGEV